MSQLKTYCGLVAIIGRPNVGKSTLFNKLLGQKIAITSSKPQTTRHSIIGIDTKDNYQIIYVDTPGLHIEEKKVINRFMNLVASSSMERVELIIFVVEGTNWTKNDHMVMTKLQNVHCPVLLVINKIDNLKDKSLLLPHIDFLSKQINFIYILPISAATGTGINMIPKIVRPHMPEAAHLFPAHYITDRSPSFLATEIIREKLIRFLGDELPYIVTVQIEKFLVTKSNCYKIYGLILVEKNSQKKIIIGNKGSTIKMIGIEARLDMEKSFATKVNLELWVKVKAGWANNELILRSLGYTADINLISY